MISGIAGTAFALLGGGGHAWSVADVLARLGARVSLVVAADTRGPWTRVVRDDDDGLRSAAAEGLAVVVAVGDNERRLSLLALAEAAGVSLPAVVAATATLAAESRLGAGAVLLEHAHVGPGAVVGRGVVVNTGADVEHGARVAAGAHIAPRVVVGGDATIGRAALIGTGAVVLPGCKVGDWAKVAAGAVVVRDVPDGVTVVGVPARPTTER